MKKSACLGILIIFLLSCNKAKSLNNSNKNFNNLKSLVVNIHQIGQYGDIVKESDGEFIIQHSSTSYSSAVGLPGGCDIIGTIDSSGLNINKGLLYINEAIQVSCNPEQGNMYHLPYTPNPNTNYQLFKGIDSRVYKVIAYTSCSNSYKLIR